VMTIHVKSVSKYILEQLVPGFDSASNGSEYQVSLGGGRGGVLNSPGPRAEN
jgi:hypothetical protein